MTKNILSRGTRMEQQIRPYSRVSKTKKIFALF